MEHAKAVPVASAAAGSHPRSRRLQCCRRGSCFAAASCPAGQAVPSLPTRGTELADARITSSHVVSNLSCAYSACEGAPRLGMRHACAASHRRRRQGAFVATRACPKPRCRAFCSAHWGKMQGRVRPLAVCFHPSAVGLVFLTPRRCHCPGCCWRGQHTASEVGQGGV